MQLSFALSAPPAENVTALVERVLEDDSLPEMARDLFRLQADEYAAVAARLAEFEAKLMKWHREDDVSRRISTIPGVGPIRSSMLSMRGAAAGGHVLRSRLCGLARTYAQRSFNWRPSRDTAVSTKARGFFSASDQTLIVGATTLAEAMREGRHKPTPWLASLLERRPGRSWWRWPWPTDSPALLAALNDIGPRVPFGR